MVPFADHVNNSVVAEVRDVELRNAFTAIGAESDPWPDSNETILGITGSSYVCERDACTSPGPVAVCEWVFDDTAEPDDAWSCGMPNGTPLIQLAGSAESFAASNTGFDISGLENVFSGEPLPE